MKDKHLELIYESCWVHAYRETPKGHYLIWYDDVCESDFYDEGTGDLMWSCDSVEEFNGYFDLVCSLEH